MGEGIIEDIGVQVGRNPEKWGSLQGPMSSWDEIGLNQLRKIYRDPSDFILIRNPETNLVFIEKRLKDGRGIRLNKDYSFKGFID